MKIVLLGIGGYGRLYLSALRDNEYNEDYEFAGYIDPMAEKSEMYQDIVDMGIKRYESLEKYFETEKADLVIVSSPIKFHVTQTCYALENGANVLCEKPVAAVIQDALKMDETAKKTGLLAAVGFQWSYCDPILNLKQDILDGKYGKALKMKTVVQWPRTHRYFNRNNWAGKIKDPSGAWVLDSVANNATAHYLHNMFYLVGDSIEESAFPKTINAEVYRSNNIENYDTFTAKIVTTKGIEMFYYASHAVDKNINPIFEFEFEKGKVVYDSELDGIVYGYINGEKITYGDPYKEEIKKAFTMIKAIKKEATVPCPIKAACPQLIVINSVAEEVEITDISKYCETIDYKEEKLTILNGMSKILMDCYNQEKLPSELGVEWAKKQEKFDVSEYSKFKGMK